MPVPTRVDVEKPPRVVRRRDWIYCKVCLAGNAIFATVLILEGKLL